MPVPDPAREPTALGARLLPKLVLECSAFQADPSRDRDVDIIARLAPLAAALSDPVIAADALLRTRVLTMLWCTVYGC